MNMQPLYSTVEREVILDYLLDNPDEEINMNALARKLKVSAGQVHHYLKILEKHSLFAGKKLTDNMITRSLRIAKNMNIIQKSRITDMIRKKIRDVKGIGIYGSWSNGTNNKNSDVDIWIKAEKDLNDSELAKMNNELSKQIKTPVEILMLTPKRMKYLKEKTQSLYYSLFNSMLIWGDRL